MLLDRGADINSMGLHGITPLDVAVSFQENELIELLTNRGGKIHRDMSPLLSPWDGVSKVRLVQDVAVYFRAIRKLVG
ncbi:hypothetical protein BDW68DRAFT_172276 [Aspergillus falconensis]